MAKPDSGPSQHSPHCLLFETQEPLCVELLHNVYKLLNGAYLIQ